MLVMHPNVSFAPLFDPVISYPCSVVSTCSELLNQEETSKQVSKQSGAGKVFSVDNKQGHLPTKRLVSQLEIAAQFLFAFLHFQTSTTRHCVRPHGHAESTNKGIISRQIGQQSITVLKLWETLGTDFGTTPAWRVSWRDQY